MDLEEHTLDDSLEERCAVCGAVLTESEIHAARETAGPFLCSVHAEEVLPVEEDDQEIARADGGGADPGERP
jgi:hypothetical protein